MSRHTPGKLTIIPAVNVEYRKTDDGWPIIWLGGRYAISQPMPASETGDASVDLERIVACWNACEGIEDPSKLRKHLDDLLHACKLAMKVHPSILRGSLIEKAVSDVERAQ